MKTIHFKNGEKQEISKEELLAIIEHMSKHGADGFRMFSYENEPYLVINISEIVFIS